MAQEHEIKIVRAFQRIYPNCPQSEPASGPLINGNATPDVVLPDCGIGIEVTRFFRGESGNHGSSVQRNCAERSKLLLETQKLFEVEQQKFVWIDVSWNSEDSFSLEPKEKLTFTRALASQVAFSIPPPNESVILEYQDLKHDILRQHIHFLAIANWKGLKRGHWHVSQFAFFGRDQSRIETIVREKETKMADYRSRCSLVWLLIVAEGQEIFSQLDREDRFADVEMKTSFDRIFVFDLFASWVDELKVSHS